MTRSIQFSKSVFYIILVMILTTSIFQNGFYWVISFATLLIIIRLLWKPYVPAVFIICMLYQWLQVFATVGFCTFLEKPIDFRTPHNGTAVIFSLIGLIAVSLGMSKMLNKIRIYSKKELAQVAQYISPRKVMLLYIIFYFLAGLIQTKAFSALAFSQLLFSIAQMKWVFFMIYAYLMLLGLANKKHFLVFFLLEFFSGLYSFFSTFKEPIFYFAIVYLSFVVELDIKKFIRFILVGVILGYLFLMWTNIKTSYRSFLNGKQQSQVITVSKEDAYNKLNELVSRGMTAEEMQYSVVTSLYRLEYTYHFSLVMDRVPSILPYEDGQLIFGSLLFVVTPRMLNPDKGLFDASAKTRKYTGIDYAGVEKGVSISLGYFAECFVDFGYIGMFFPLFIIGLWMGFIMFYFAKEKGMNPLLAYTLASSIIYTFIAFESDTTIILGRTLINFVIFVVLIKYFLPILTNYLRE